MLNTDKYNQYIDAKSQKLKKQINAQLNKSVEPGDIVKVKGKFLKRNSSQDSEKPQHSRWCSTGVP